MQKHSKWKAVLLLLVVFACGAGGGVLGAKYYLGRQFKQTFQGDPRAFEDHVLDRMSRELGLTADQRQLIRPIITDTAAKIHALRQTLQPQFDALIDADVKQIKVHLSEKQGKELDRMRQRLEEHRKKFGDRPPPPHGMDAGGMMPPPPGMGPDGPPPPPPPAER